MEDPCSKRHVDIFYELIFACAGKRALMRKSHCVVFLYHNFAMRIHTMGRYFDLCMFPMYWSPHTIPEKQDEASKMKDCHTLTTSFFVGLKSLRHLFRAWMVLKIGNELTSLGLLYRVCKQQWRKGLLSKFVQSQYMFECASLWGQSRNMMVRF